MEAEDLPSFHAQPPVLLGRRRRAASNDRTARDFLHWIRFLLFGYHIVRAIIYLLSKTIVEGLAAAYLTEHGNRKAPVNQSTSSNILRRLARRLSRITADESCLTISEKFARHFLKVCEEGKSKLTGGRMVYLMLVAAGLALCFSGPGRKRAAKDQCCH